MVARRPGQVIDAPTQASAILRGDGFLGSVGFRAGERFAEIGSYRVSGTRGVITHSGQSLGGDEVLVSTAEGVARIPIDTDWFSNGMSSDERQGGQECVSTCISREWPSHVKLNTNYSTSSPNE